MKLTVQIKLLADKKQSIALKKTIESTNSACNRLSELTWPKKEFRRFQMQGLFYAKLRSEFSLSSQIVIRLIAKVADAYIRDQNSMRKFRRHGSISYDSRIVTINVCDSLVSIWTVNGRKKMPFVCGDHHRKLLRFPKGESDLLLRGEDWFLNICVDVPDGQEQEAVEWLGIDLGLVNIAKDSEGITYGNAKKVSGLRDRRWRQRKRLQSKCTRSAKRVLRRLSGRESRFVKLTNHEISKQIVTEAKRTGRGIALEDLKGIRNRIRVRKSQRRRLHSWAFFDLQWKIAYKSKLIGVPVKFVDPRNSSRTCPACGNIEKANRKTRNTFECVDCGFTADADTNAAREISRRAVVIQPNERNGVRVQVQK